MVENNKKLSIDENIVVGSLVCLKTREFEQITQKTTKTDNDWEQINTGLVALKSPIMVVIEIVQETKQEKDSNLYNSSTGKQTNFEKQIKVNCKWYSVKEGEFKQRWFAIELLEHLETQLIEQNFELGNVVSLKTYSIEASQTENGYQEGNEKIVIINKQIEKSLSFCPPIMVVSQIVYEPQKQSLPLYSKKTGKLIREITKEEYKIKCTFFNSKKQQFTDETFIAEALIAIPLPSAT